MTGRKDIAAVVARFAAGGQAAFSAGRQTPPPEMPILQLMQELGLASLTYANMPKPQDPAAKPVFVVTARGADALHWCARRERMAAALTDEILFALTEGKE